ncbi:MAG: hypothetical protein JO108_05745 [Acidobacteriaceae bacterium]|nr:hypothetical protein [Acidobacteriaceae bacterium]
MIVISNVRSERAGQRVMKSITQFITHKLKLNVNEAKSAVARRQERKFLGFSFTAGPEVKRVIVAKALAVVILDDATSEIYYAQLVEEESTRTVMSALREVIETEGLFCSLYSDRGSHFFVTRKAGERVDPHRLTQVGGAMKELGVQMIAAYSPQARGRCERSFGTWQNRLPQELRLAGISTLEQANPFLRE